jgi:hypothetical protein
MPSDRIGDRSNLGICQACSGHGKPVLIAHDRRRSLLRKHPEAPAVDEGKPAIALRIDRAGAGQGECAPNDLLVDRKRAPEEVLELVLCDQSAEKDITIFSAAASSCAARYRADFSSRVLKLTTTQR